MSKKIFKSIEYTCNNLTVKKHIEDPADPAHHTEPLEVKFEGFHVGLAEVRDGNTGAIIGKKPAPFSFFIDAQTKEEAFEKFKDSAITYLDEQNKKQEQQGSSIIIPKGSVPPPPIPGGNNKGLLRKV